MRTELPKEGNIIFVTPRKLTQYAATTLAPVRHQLIIKLKFRLKQPRANIVTAPITVQNLRTPRPLYVIEGTESVVILGTDWMDRYQADIRRSDNIMKVQVNDEKARIGLQY